SGNAHLVIQEPECVSATVLPDHKSPCPVFPAAKVIEQSPFASLEQSLTNLLAVTLVRNALHLFAFRFE
ncbi:MAG: hypothetical protein ACOCX4_03410, partial [Planctomycetota bacterium]